MWRTRLGGPTDLGRAALLLHHHGKPPDHMVKPCCYCGTGAKHTPSPPSPPLSPPLPSSRPRSFCAVQVTFHDASRYPNLRVPLLTDLYGFTRASLSPKGVLYSSPPTPGALRAVQCARHPHGAFCFPARACALHLGVVVASACGGGCRLPQGGCSGCRVQRRSRWQAAGAAITAAETGRGSHCERLWPAVAASRLLMRVVAKP